MVPESSSTLPASALRANRGHNQYYALHYLCDALHCHGVTGCPCWQVGRLAMACRHKAGSAPTCHCLRLIACASQADTVCRSTCMRLAMVCMVSPASYMRLACIILVVSRCLAMRLLSQKPPPIRYCRSTDTKNPAAIARAGQTQQSSLCRYSPPISTRVTAGPL